VKLPSLTVLLVTVYTSICIVCTLFCPVLGLLPPGEHPIAVDNNNDDNIIIIIIIIIIYEEESVNRSQMK
jgi:hypothetical protein